MNEIMEMSTVAKELNNRTFTDYFYRLMLLARSVFEWENLPNGMNEKWIEKYLFSEGKCVFFHDNIKGYMVARVTENGILNEYDEATTVLPYATGYTGSPLENNVDCVIISNNDIMRPTSHTIQLYSLKLTDIDRTISTNILAQKTPVIVKCSEKQRLTLRRLMNQRNDNEPIIWGDKDLDTDGIQVLDIAAPIVFKDLELQKHMVFNECMTFLGINNANQDKRERLVDDEVQANNEQVQANFNLMFKARKEACKRINKLFGLNINVKKRNLDSFILAREGFGGSENPLNDSKGGKIND